MTKNAFQAPSRVFFNWSSDIMSLVFHVKYTFFFFLNKTKQYKLVHWHFDLELTVHLGQHFQKTLKAFALPSHFYWPFARSSSSFTQCSRGHSSWPTVFWPSRGKPLVCGAGSWRYGLIWPSVTGSQTVGIAAALAELLFSDHVAKAWRLF